MLEKIQKSMILSQMGIKHWIGNASAVKVFHLEDIFQNNNFIKNVVQENVTRKDANQSVNTGNLVSKTVVSKELTTISISKIEPTENTEELSNVALVENIESNETIKISVPVIPSFKVQGVHYNGWVLLVDTRTLNESENALWISICSVLNVRQSDLAFPICEGMDTIDIAQITLSGFLYGLGQPQDFVKIIKLNQCLDKILEEKILLTAKSMKYFHLTTLLESPLQKQSLWHCLQQ